MANTKSTQKRDEKKISKLKLVEKIKEDSKDKLLPNIKAKMEETSKLIVDLLQEKGEDKVNNIQIMSMIAKKSTFDIAYGGNPQYTPQELMASFNYYLDMINKINEIKKFPPTVESFCCFIGISQRTFENWLTDYEKKDAMEYIQSYLLGMLATSSLTGEVREISSIYLSKAMGKVEKSQPIQIKHEVTHNIDDIQSQLEALKRDKVIEADYVEIEK